MDERGGGNVVFFDTFEGTPSVDRDQIAAARLLGACELTARRPVVVPSALAWLRWQPQFAAKERVGRPRLSATPAAVRGWLPGAGSGYTAARTEPEPDHPWPCNPRTSSV